MSIDVDTRELLCMSLFKDNNEDSEPLSYDAFFFPQITRALAPYFRIFANIEAKFDI